MQKYNYVYLTTNLVNNKQYIGSHYGKINDSYLGSGNIINESFLKYKRENFKKEILEICESREKAFLLEEFYIKKYNTLSPNGYNISPTGGMNEWGGSHSIETKKKLSNLASLRIGEKNPNFGNHLSENAKNKIGIVKKGKNYNEIYGDKSSLIKEKISNSSKGRIFSEDHKEKIKLSKIGKARPTKICKYCGKETAVGNFERYHDNNCKLK